MKKLTGATKNNVHVTDVTNASRTMLLNINTLNWDADMCRYVLYTFSKTSSLTIQQIPGCSDAYFTKDSIVIGNIWIYGRRASCRDSDFWG